MERNVDKGTAEKLLANEEMQQGAALSEETLKDVAGGSGQPEVTDEMLNNWPRVDYNDGDLGLRCPICKSKSGWMITRELWTERMVCQGMECQKCKSKYLRVLTR